MYVWQTFFLIFVSCLSTDIFVCFNENQSKADLGWFCNKCLQLVYIYIHTSGTVCCALLV